MRSQLAAMRHAGVNTKGLSSCLIRLESLHRLRCGNFRGRRVKVTAAAVTASPLQVSRQLAASRAVESLRPDGLFADPFAPLLLAATDEQAASPDPHAASTTSSDSSSTASSSTASSKSSGGSSEVLDVIATRYIDECVLNAVAATSVNRIRAGDFRQVVLLGDGMDTRPFRLPWPEGTLLFLVAPPEVHQAAESGLRLAARGGGSGGRGSGEGSGSSSASGSAGSGGSAGSAGSGAAAHVPRGCLLRRVRLNLASLLEPAAGDTGADGAPAADDLGLLQGLEAAGFRADRLSLWALQGLHGLGLGAPELRRLLGEVADCAAFHSLFAGELPGPLGRAAAENLLADAGLLGTVVAHGGAGTGGGYGRWDAERLGQAPGEGAAPSAAAQRWLFAAQQLRLSLAQMGVYERHVAAAEEADEDFPGDWNFS